MNTILSVLIFAMSPARSSAAVQTPQIDTFVQSDFRDAKVQVTIVKGNQAELRKINKDFGMGYKYNKSSLSFKEPLKMRFEVQEEDSSIVYIVNDTTEWVKFGQIKLPKQNLATKPGRRQTTLEIGILTPSLFSSYLDAKYIDRDQVAGTVTFDLTYKQSDLDKTRFRVWIDQAKKYVAKREWFNQEGKLIATFDYSEPIQVGSVWFPTKMEVRNGENILAGVTKYEEIKINTGLPDTMFEG